MRTIWKRTVSVAAAVAVLFGLSAMLAEWTPGPSPTLLATRYHARHRTARFYERSGAKCRGEVRPMASVTRATKS
ncbi:MAG: hypothetical protein IT425_11900 [Pirellulales bacterium]|nr:hypothetical protein [Pirellulales bacterium]